MNDHTIPLTTVVAYLLWGAGIIAVGLSFVGPIQLTAVGLLLAGAGGVLQIYGFIRRLEEREQNAFNIGRDFASIPKQVRSLR